MHYHYTLCGSIPATGRITVLDGVHYAANLAGTPFPCFPVAGAESLSKRLA